MHYSRAGLVALGFALIFSLVSAVPVPITGSRLSAFSPRSPSLNGQDHIQLGTASISRISSSDRMSTLPHTTRPTHRHQIATNMENQLVRRNIFSKIKHAFQSVGRKIKSGFQKAGAAIKKGFQKVGQGIKKVAQKVGNGIKKVAQKVGSGIKKVAQKVGSGIKTAAKKVGKFMKTTGAKIAKFGLKVVQSVDEVAGKVVGFIPGIGKPLGKVIEAEGKVAGFVSDHIHVKLPGKLQKGMNVMNKADKIIDYIPRRREFSEEEAFQQRDIGEAYHFEERDDIALENREESYFEANERDIYERYDLDYE